MLGVSDVFPDDGMSDFKRKLIVDDRPDEQQDGTVITPDPTGIVIKTLLMKEKHNHLPIEDCVDDSSLPRTLSSIYSASQNNVAVAPETNITKVFLNICTHPLIAVPSKRIGLDEGSGEEVDGWRLPMSLGELRPCYDKVGKTAIAVDCVLNPSIVQEMNTDSHYFHFVCDLIVQCASRKFGRTWFDGHDLDRRFKLPKMKYAGYVDETTGFPVIPHDARPVNGLVAKQRVKRHGGKLSIIEELDCSPYAHNDSGNRVSATTVSPRINVAQAREIDGYRIELYISYNQCLTPLFDFLRLASELDGIVPLGQPSDTLRGIIKSPKLKKLDEDKSLHDSQLLLAPIPLNTIFFRCGGEESMSNTAETCNGSKGHSFDQFSIIAKCSVRSSIQMSEHMSTTPTVELSAFTLFVSDEECRLPFPVDAHQTSVTSNPRTGHIEIRMPVLQCSGPDPGTRQWELQKAFRGKGAGATVDDKAVNSNTVPGERIDEIAQLLGNSAGGNTFDTYFRGYDDDAEEHDSQRLPEDTFHSQDVLSRHFLHQQEEERNARKSAKTEDISRDGADVELINLDEMRQKQASAKEDVALKVAENVLRNHLHDHFCKGFVMGLV